MDNQKIFMLESVAQTTEAVSRCEAIIPDYYPEILKIARTHAQAFILKTRFEEGRLILEGQVLYNILYIPADQKGLCSFLHKHSFEASLQAGSEGLVIPKPRVQYASCKLLSPTKLSLKASIGVDMDILYKKEASFFKSSDKEIISLNKSAVISCPKFMGQKAFTLCDEAEIQDNIGTPLYTDAIPIIKESKVILSKVIVKGEILLKTLYCSRSDEIKEFSHRIPFSQIIDAADTKEGDTPICNIHLCDISTALSLGDKDGCSILEYSVGANFTAAVLEEEKVCYTADCFHIKSEIKRLNQRACFSKYSLLAKGSTKVGGKINIPDGIGRIIDCSAYAKADSCSMEAAALRVAGSIEVRLLYKNRGDETVHLERALPFEARLSAEAADPTLFITEAHILDYDADISAANEAHFTFSLYVRAYIFTAPSNEFVQGVEIIADKPLKKGYIAPLSVYFAKKGESIWDIAKAYFISPERIQGLNGCEDILKEERQLLLPRYYK